MTDFKLSEIDCKTQAKFHCREKRGMIISIIPLALVLN